MTLGSWSVCCPDLSHRQKVPCSHRGHVAHSRQEHSPILPCLKEARRELEIRYSIFYI